MRVKLTLPEPILFRCIIPVRITDLNYGNHIGNDRYLGFAHEARMQWLHSMYFNEMNIGGVGLIMADAALQFKAEGFYGDSLQVEIALGNMSTSSFDMYYRLEGLRQEARIEIARIKTGMVCYDYSLKKVAPIPSEFKLAIQCAIDKIPN